MTKEQAKDLWPVIKAWSEGKTIQCSRGIEWMDVYQEAEPDFTDRFWQWRIKPELRHFWVGLPCSEVPNGLVYCDTKPDFAVKLIHCVEVLDDQSASEVKK